jgi:hypothetical protein
MVCPANWPPRAMRAMSSETSVVLPAFHWLVSSVTAPRAR